MAEIEARSDEWLDGYEKGKREEKRRATSFNIETMAYQIAMEASRKANNVYNGSLFTSTFDEVYDHLKKKLGILG